MNKRNIFIILVVVIVLIFIFYRFVFGDIIPKIEVMDSKVSINNLYIYGTSFNIEGVIPNVDYDDMDIVLYNGKFYDYDIEIDNNMFSFSYYINDGLYLEEINKGKYYMFLRVCNKNEDGECGYSYYVLDNKSGYDESIYYTMSSTNRKIIINSDNEYGTIGFNVRNNKDKNIYDVVIDPGHGGVDSGAISKDGKYLEKDISMDISKVIYDKLSSKGIKVKLTREKDTFGSDDYFEEYNLKDYIGRAVIPRSVNAKYVFSIHLNSLDRSNTRGLEIYTACGINYEFVNGLVSNIIDNTSMVTSSKDVYKISDGVYTHNFTDSEVISAFNDYDKKGYERYDVTTKSNYLYMIRETGGIMTGAYVDGRNKKVGINPYFNNNIGVEAYLIELGYLSNSKDLDYIVNNKKEYGNVIADYIYSNISK